MGEDWSSEAEARAAGAAIGRELAVLAAKARLKRSAREVSGYLDEEEQLVAPVMACYRGGWVPVLVGAGIFLPALMVWIFTSHRIGILGNVVLAAFVGAGFLVLCSALFVQKYYALALTDRRLIVFRRGGASWRHLRGIYLAVPRSDVSADFAAVLGRGILSLKFAPAAGLSPMKLNFAPVDSQIARSIYQALAAPAASAPAGRS